MTAEERPTWEERMAIASWARQVTREACEPEPEAEDRPGTLIVNNFKGGTGGTAVSAAFDAVTFGGSDRPLRFAPGTERRPGFHRG